MILNDKPLFKRVSLLPEVQYLIEKYKNIFTSITNSQAKQIADAISNIQGLQTALDSKENISNKQNNLAIDGTGTKYPTVDAVNSHSYLL